MAALATIVALLVLFPAAAGAAYGVYTSEELAFVGLLNDYRQANGLRALLVSDALSDAAEKHSRDMGVYAFFDHTTVQSDYFPAGASPWDRMAACGYGYQTYKGENIAAGQATAQLVFTTWKGSAPHNSNMLNADFAVIGVSLDYTPGSPYGRYWTTDFGGVVDPTAHQVGSGSPPPDATSPTVSFSAPGDGATVTGDVAIAAAASDDVGVARVEFFIDGALAATSTKAPYRFTWRPGGTTGWHVLALRAYDAAGNRAEAGITVQVVPVTTTTVAPTTTTTTRPAPTTEPPTTTTRPPTATTTTLSPPPLTTTTTAPPTTVPPTNAPPTTSTTEPPAPPVVSPPGFADVPPDHRFYQEVSALAGAQVVGGFPDGSFRPDERVTRAQFAKVILLATGRHTDEIDHAERATFPDVPWDGHPYPFDYVEEAVTHGIIKGLNDGLFGPYAPITRAQLALMLVRAGGDRLATPPDDYHHGFTDVPSYAEEAVRVARYNQLLSGTTLFTFDPYGLATRGHVAKMTSELMDRLADSPTR